VQSRAAGAQEAALDLLVAAALQPATRGAAAAEPGLGARLAAAAAALLRATGSAAAAAALLGNLLMDPALRCQARPRSTCHRTGAPRGNQWLTGQSCSPCNAPHLCPSSNHPPAGAVV